MKFIIDKIGYFMKILIVDDSEAEIVKLKAIVEKAGHLAIIARNGEEGIALAMERKPDLIFMDVVMPKMDGFRATRTLKRNEELSYIPIVLVSTKNQAVDVEWAKRQGANHLIGKPYQPSEILHQIALYNK